MDISSIILWTTLGISSGYVTENILNHYHYKLYHCNISNKKRVSIVMFITFFAFLKGYTGNDLYTNIKLFITKEVR